MNLIPFFFGLFISLLPVLLCLKLSGGRFLFITNEYFAGALFAFWIWALFMFFFYMDLRFGLVGVATGDDGGALLGVLTSSVRGFIVGGLLSAAAYRKFMRKT